MNQHIIIFDGVCLFCNASINFILTRDRADKFVFAPMQRHAAQQLIVDYDIQGIENDTFVLIKNGRCFYRSDAAIEIAKDLPGAWNLLRFMQFIPRFIRDYLYNFVARNRYRILGKTDTCVIPTQAQKK